MKQVNVAMLEDSKLLLVLQRKAIMYLLKCIILKIIIQKFEWALNNFSGNGEI